jgi:hypothetical protein
MNHLNFHDITIVEEIFREEADSAGSASHNGRAFSKGRATRKMRDDLLH